MALHVRNEGRLNGKAVETGNNSENKGGKPEEETDNFANEGGGGTSLDTVNNSICAPWNA